jgi:uncharacterized protein YkwD
MEGVSPHKATLSKTWYRLLVLSSLALLFFLCGDATFGSDDPVRLSPYEKQLFHSINQYRIRNGLNPLRVDKTLQELAGNHSRNMDAKNCLSHDAFHQRFTQCRRSQCVENVGWNSPTAEDQMKGWKNSAGHNSNLLNKKIRFAGISRCGDYVTFFACD